MYIYIYIYIYINDNYNGSFIFRYNSEHKSWFSWTKFITASKKMGELILKYIFYINDAIRLATTVAYLF